MTTLQLIFSIYFGFMLLNGILVSAAKHGRQMKPGGSPYWTSLSTIIWIVAMIVMSVDSDFNAFCWQMNILHILTFISLCYHVYAGNNPHKVQVSNYNVVATTMFGGIIFALQFTGGLYEPIVNLITR